MRFKLILSVRSDSYGNVLPVSYQYELSSCIYRKLRECPELYRNWLGMNGFFPEYDMKYRLFSISNFYIPKIKVEQDRLFVLARRIQMWISFLPERGTEEFVNTLLKEKTLLIGDRKSKVELVVEDIVPCRPLVRKDTLDYLSLSPIVLTNLRGGKGYEYLSPASENYNEYLLQSILRKYEYFYGKPFEYDPGFKMEFLNEPKRKGNFIMKYTSDETKIIGYMYKFRLTLHPELHQLAYCTGIGEKINLGFGCIEELK